MKSTVFLAPLALMFVALAPAACGDDDDELPSNPSGQGGSAGRAGGPSTSGGGGSPSAGAGGGAAGATTTACGATLPAAYDGTNFATNAAAELAVVGQLKALTDEMKASEASNAPAPEATLKGLFDAGAPSLRAVTTPYFAAKVDARLAAFAAIPAGSTWAPPVAPATDATPGKLGDWLFDARGVDLRQAVEKGLYGAALYHHALTLINGAVTPATIDKLVAIFGAKPALVGDSDAAVALDNADRFSAQYAERRSPKDATSKAPASGPYFEIKRALIAAQADAVKGVGCEADLAAQLTTFRQQWERSNYATVVYYMNDAATKLGSTDAAVRAAGLHSYGEALGFVDGFKATPAAGRTITDAQIDELLAKLKAPAAGPVDSYLFYTNAADHAVALSEVTAQIATIYGFGNAEVESFRTNY